MQSRLPKYLKGGGGVAASESGIAAEFPRNDSASSVQDRQLLHALSESVQEQPRDFLSERQRLEFDLPIQSLTYEPPHVFELAEDAADTSLHSLLNAAQAFNEPGVPVEHVGVEDANVQGSLSEMPQSWWMQASDITLGASPDRLAGANINFGATWAAASQSQWSLSRETNLVQPREERIFAEIFCGRDEPSWPTLKRAVPPFLHSATAGKEAQATRGAGVICRCA